MKPSDIIQQFGLETSTDENDFLIAADCAEEKGLSAFAQFLRKKWWWLCQRQRLEGDPMLDDQGADLEELYYTEFYPDDACLMISSFGIPEGYGPLMADGSGKGSCGYGIEGVPGGGNGAGAGAYGIPTGAGRRNRGSGQAFVVGPTHPTIESHVGYGEGMVRGKSFGAKGYGKGFGDGRGLSAFEPRPHRQESDDARDGE